MNKEQVLKELLERRQFWEYELELIEKQSNFDDNEFLRKLRLSGAISGIDVAIQYIKEIA